MKHKVFLFLSLTILLSGCGAKFERTEFIDGTFTPNGTVQVEGRPINSIKDNYNITIGSPIHIKEIGVLRLNFFQMENRKDYWRTRDGFVYFEVGISELSGKGDYYIPTYYLKNSGNFEYHQRTLSPIEWIQYHPIKSFLIFAVIIYITILILKQIRKNQQILREKEEREKEEKRLREIREAQLKKEREIERRKLIIEEIANVQYKETEKEVNKTLIPTLINELFDIYTGLHSDNMNELIINGSLTDFENIISSIKSELTRLRKLALDAQKRGYTDEEREYDYSEENNGKMTKEKAFEILGLKQTATKEETKKAYRNLVKKYNSDQRTNLEDHIKEMLDDKMKEINNAKDYLSNLGLL